MPTDTFIPTRPSLLARLKDGDEQAGWQGFLETYGRLIRGAALKSRLTEEEADDVLQETALAVVKNIGGFQYDPARCAFKSWLLLITRQRIIWQLRQREKVGVQASACPPGVAFAGTLKHGLQHDGGPRTATIDRIPPDRGCVPPPSGATRWGGTDRENSRWKTADRAAPSATPPGLPG